MTDADGDGIWEATIPLLSGTYEYKFSADSWTIQEMNDQQHLVLMETLPIQTER